MNSLPESQHHEAPARHPENVPGDFYVENEVCTACGAPEAEAPDLIEHSKFEYGHCYFKKQPRTPDEVERAINAIAVSCIAGIRYGGKNEEILRQLYEMGEAAQCDHKPKGNFKPVIWNKVKALYTGTVQELYTSITTQVGAMYPYLDSEIVELHQTINSFEFVYRWAGGLAGTHYKCTFSSDAQIEIRMTTEPGGFLISLRGRAQELNRILSGNENVTQIEWFDLDRKLSVVKL